MSDRWLCVLRLESGSRPGVLSRLAQPFAERGLSLAEVVAAERHGQPIVVLAFVASPRLRDHLARRLARSPDVTSVEMLPAAGRGAWQLLGADEPRSPGGGWGR